MFFVGVCVVSLVFMMLCVLLTCLYYEGFTIFRTAGSGLFDFWGVLFPLSVSALLSSLITNVPDI